MPSNSPARWVRLVAAVLLPLLFLSMIGVPLPVPHSKNRDERYPCENCVCSCSSAAACWDKCCCHTDEEKLVWAEKNGVTPPKFVVDRLAAKNKSTTKVPKAVIANQSATKQHSCSFCTKRNQSTESRDGSCQDCGLKSDCKLECKDVVIGTQKVAITKSCSVSGKASECEPLQSRKECCSSSSKVHKLDLKSEARKVRYVMLNSALKCKGIQLALMIFSHCLPTQTVLINVPQPTQIGQLMIVDETAGSIFQLLDDPVPRG